LSIDIGMSIEKKLCALDVFTMAMRRRKMERRFVAGISSVDIGLAVKQELDAVASPCRKMERRIFVAITSIDGGATIKKNLNALKVAFR